MPEVPFIALVISCVIEAVFAFVMMRHEYRKANEEWLKFAAEKYARGYEIGYLEAIRKMGDE